MKYKTTKKDMKERYDKILEVGYCNMQYLLQFQNEIAYSVRQEGWACDYYDVNNILISTGYSPINSKNMNDNYNLMNEYENKAREICCNYNLAYEEQKEQVNNLLIELLQQLQ